LDTPDWTTAGLWLAVLASGLYHGLNPGMGWPLAVSAGLLGRGREDLARAMALLAVGHLLAMLAILLPFTVMLSLLEWQRQIRVAAACLVIAAGVFLLLNRRHPRSLARIPPGRLALWSFAIALAHGAGLMLLPIYLGICEAGAPGAAPGASATLMAGNLRTAGLVALAHTLAMLVSGGAMALLVHGWLGLTFIGRSWLNLDLVWAASLILVGCVALATI
jgi:hypothetical protein